MDTMNAPLPGGRGGLRRLLYRTFLIWCHDMCQLTRSLRCTASILLLRVAPRVSVKAKNHIQHAVCEKALPTAYSVLDYDCGVDSYEWSCA